MRYNAANKISTVKEYSASPQLPSISTLVADGKDDIGTEIFRKLIHCLNE